MAMRLNLIVKNKKEFWKSINLLIVKKILFSISIIYLIFCLRINFNKISLEIDYVSFKFHLILSFAFCILSIFFNAYAWSSITCWLGFGGNSLRLVSFYVLTNSLKYVPGGIWHFFERFNYLKTKTNKYLSFYSIILEPYIMFSASLLMVSFGTFYSPLFLLFILPSIFLNKKLIYFVLLKLELLKNKSIKLFNISNTKLEIYSKIKLQSFFPIKSLLIEILFIFSKFIGFLICYNIFNGNDIQNNLVLFIVFCLSWSIGLIVPAAPGGLGVFEASFLFLTRENFSQSSLIETLVYFRLISTIADLFLSSPLLLKRIIKKI